MLKKKMSARLWKNNTQKVLWMQERKYRSAHNLEGRENETQIGRDYKSDKHGVITKKERNS